MDETVTVVRHTVGSVDTAGVAVDKSVSVAISLLLGSMEPDVRLNMTLPACTGKGCVLPSVPLMHVLVDESPGPQQKSPTIPNV